jgi:hypothetical protein
MVPVKMVPTSVPFAAGYEFPTGRAPILFLVLNLPGYRERLVFWV